MSLEVAVTDVKRMVEAGMFKAAGPDALANRPQPYEALLKEMLDKCVSPEYQKMREGLEKLSSIFSSGGSRLSAVRVMADLWKESKRLNVLEGSSRFGGDPTSGGYGYWNDAMQDLTHECHFTSKEWNQMVSIVKPSHKVLEAGMFKPAGEAELANRPQEKRRFKVGDIVGSLSHWGAKAKIEAYLPGGYYKIRFIDKNLDGGISDVASDLNLYKVYRGRVQEAGMFKPASDANLAVRKEELIKHFTAEQKARHARGIYYFDELSDEAKEKALDWARYIEVDYPDWWQHDYFFQPPDKELKKAGVPDGKMLFSFNDKDVSFDLDRGSYLEISHLDVNNTDQFYNWLGIPRRMRDKVYYKFGTSGYRNSDTELEIMKEDYSDLTPWELKFVERAQEKFKDHVAWCLKGLREDYEYRTSDEQVAETIRANEYEFDEEGNRA